jgi:hypothetical protein
MMMMMLGHAVIDFPPNHGVRRHTFISVGTFLIKFVPFFPPRHHQLTVIVGVCLVLPLCKQTAVRLKHQQQNNQIVSQYIELEQLIPQWLVASGQ